MARSSLVAPVAEMSGGRPREQSGIALVLVLWLVAALALISAAVAATSREGVKAARDARLLLAGEALCDGAIHLALFELLREGRSTDRILTGSYRVDDRSVSVTSVPANGFININAADESLLELLFRHGADLAPDVARQLAERVLDWRDPDGVARPEGAEDDDYAAAGVPFRTRGGRFDSIDDLMQVLGLDFSVFDRIRHLVVAGGAEARVNPMAAPAGVLLVLAAGDAATARAVEAGRESLGLATDLTGLSRNHLGTGASRVLRMEARVALPDGRNLVRAQWISLDGGVDRLPWLTLAAEPARFGRGS